MYQLRIPPDSAFPSGLFGLFRHFGYYFFPSGVGSHPLAEQWFLSRETSQKYRPMSEDTEAFSPNEGSAGTDGISDKHAESCVRIKSSSSEAAVSHLLMM